MATSALTVGCTLQCIFTFVMLFNTKYNIHLNILKYFLSKEKIVKQNP